MSRRFALGFTSKEFLMVLVVVGILCVGVIPVYYMMRSSHRQAEFEKAVGILQASLNQWRERPENRGQRFPEQLDNLPAGSICKGCFVSIVPTGITSNLWYKKSPTEYLFSEEKKTLIYDATNGVLRVFKQP